MGLGPVPSATAQTPLNTLSYVGTLDSSFMQPSGTDTTHLEWDLKGENRFIDSNVMTWKFAKLVGGTFTGVVNFQPCSASLSAAANPNGVYAPGISPDTGNRWDVRVYNPGNATANSGSPTSYQVTTDGGCNMTEAYGLVSLSEAQAANSVCAKSLAPDYLVLGNGPSTTDLSCPLTTVPNTSYPVQIQITASLSFYGRGTGKSAPTPSPTPSPSPAPGTPPTGPPTPSPTRAKEKVIALDDLGKTLPRDVAECFDSARAGLSTRVAGPLSAQALAQLIPGFDAGCATDNARLVHDWYIINDPPDPKFGSVAVPARAKAISLPHLRRGSRVVPISEAPRGQAGPHSAHRDSRDCCDRDDHEPPVRC